MTFIKHISIGGAGDGESPDRKDGDASRSPRNGGGRPSSSKRPLTAFILSGGGARGAYECGVYQSLVEHGIEPDVLVGTSVGAINATAIAMGMSPQTLTEIWLSISSPESWLPGRVLKRARLLFGNGNVFRNRTDLWNLPNWTYLFDTHPLRATLRKYFHPEALTITGKQLVITAVEIQSGTFRIFKNGEITMDHVLASASIPIVFPWTRIGQEIYWDGGLLANVPPLRTAIEVEPDVTEIYMVKLFPAVAPRPRTLVECIERAIEITLQGALNSEIAHMEFMNRLIEEGRIQGPFRPIKLHTIEFHEPLEALSIINFSYDHVKNLVEQGKRDTDLYFLARAREETANRRAEGLVRQEEGRRNAGNGGGSRRRKARIRVSRRLPTGPSRVRGADGG